MTRSRVRGPGPAAVALFGALQICLGCLFLGRSSAAVTAAGVVILLQPTPTTAGVRRCLTRIRSELTAGGLDVTIVDRGSSNDPFSVANALNRERGSIATIALLGDPDKGLAELWIVDHISGREAVQRIVAPTDEPSRVPEILAVRALELLRASALELLVVTNRAAADAARTSPIVGRSAPQFEPQPGAQPTRQQGIQPGPAATASRDGAPGRLAVETGVSLFQSVGGPAAAVVPLIRLRLRSARAPLLRLTVAGLGTQPRVDAAQGSARVGYDLALLEAGAVFRRDRRVHPVVTLGAGALRVTVDGNGAWPYQGRRGARWAALVAGSVGIMTSIAGQLSLAIDLTVLWAAPYPTIRFAGADAATIGRPALFAALTLVAWL